MYIEWWLVLIIDLYNVDKCMLPTDTLTSHYPCVFTLSSNPVDPLNPAYRRCSLSIDGKKRPSHLANAPPIGPKSLASRQTPTSAHVPPLPQAQPRPAPAHPRQTHSTLPDNRRIMHHPDPATQQGIQLDESGDRHHGSSGHHDQGSSQGQPAPGRRFQNIKQNGMLDNDIEHQVSD